MIFTITVIDKYVPMNRQPCGYACPKCHKKGGLMLTVYQKHIHKVWLSYQVTKKTTGSVYCEKCDSDIAATAWTDDIEAFYLKTAKETTLEKAYNRYTWLAKLCLLFTAVILLALALAFVFTDELKSYHKAKRIAEENRQDVVLQVGNKIEVSYKDLYLNSNQGRSSGAGVQWFEVVQETKKAYMLRKIAPNVQLNRDANTKKEIFEIAKKKSTDGGFALGGRNGADGLYINSDITKVEK